MKPRPSTLFRIESALAGAAAALGAVTIFWRDWIEWIFGADPDQHSGSVEWLIVGALLFSALALAALACTEWRRIRRIGRSAPEAAGWDATL
jgi:divalent metal cation (Fe/Co/Zn/Cd) transporter